MGFMDKFKEAKDKAMEMADSASKKAKDMYNEKMEEYAQKKAYEEARDKEMKERADQYRNYIINSIITAYTGNEFLAEITNDELLKFTKDFYEKILLPANSVSKSCISMYPYIQDKEIKGFKNSVLGIKESETPIIYLKDSMYQEFLITSEGLYFKVKAPETEGDKYFAIGRIPNETISSYKVVKDEAKYSFLVNEVKITELPIVDGQAEDFITLNNYFTCISSKDFDITNEEINDLVKEKIGPKIYGEIKKYMIYDDELLVYFAWGADSISAKDYIVCTNKQIIVMDRELFGATSNIKQLYYEDITSAVTIQNSGSSTLGGFLLDAALTMAFKQCDLQITAAGAITRINTLNKVEAERVIAIYHEFRKKSKESSSQPQVIVKESEPKVDVIAQIKELAALKDAGILTEEEFSEKKAELLKRL